MSECQAGFTLIELLVVMIVAAIIAAATLGILASTTNAFNNQQTRIQNQDDARLALGLLTRYVRMATSSADNQTSQSNAIATALPQELVFYCDVDGDDIAEKVRYYLDSTTLLSETTEPVWVTTPTPHWEYPSAQSTGILVQEGIRNGASPLFRYYRYSAGSRQEFSPVTAADRQEIISISISLSVNEDPGLATSEVVLTADVQIRQRYDGGL